MRAASGPVKGLLDRRPARFLALSSTLLVLGCVTEPLSPHKRIVDTVRFEPESQGEETPDLRGSAPRLRANEVQGADGRITKFYYFRAGQVATYRAVLQRGIPHLALPDVQISEKANFIVDPRAVQATGSLYSPDPSRIPAATEATSSADLKSSSVVADLLVITAPRSVLEEVDEMLRETLLEAPQIEIEARIVSVVIDDKTQWGLTGTVIPGTVADPARTFFRQGDLTLPINQPQELQLTLSHEGDNLSAQVFLEAVHEASDSDVLSAPKVVVLNGHRAVIETGSETPIVSPKIDSTGQITSALVSFAPVGVRLIITPFVVDKDLVQLDVSAHVSTITGSVAVARFSNGTINNPIISRQDATTVVNVRSGQRVLIGGLTVNERIENVIKVPLLGDIPLLGNLFRSTIISHRKTSVLYLIRPRVVTPDELFFEQEAIPR